MPFQIIRNDITKMHVDAIVNTANPCPGYGAGIDCAVYSAAGEELLSKRQEIGAIERGSSVITPGYKLPAKFIIHTVGTAWRGGDYGEEDIIRSCYRSVFTVATENRINSLAIPLLASGSYGFPKGIALRIALSEIEAFMAHSDMDVYLVVFDEKAVALSTELYGDIDEYISDNYVEEAKEAEYFGKTSVVREITKLFSPVCGKSTELRDESISYDEEVHSNIEEPIILASMAAPRSLDDVVADLDKTFMEMVFTFADAKGISDVEVQHRANLDRKAFSKLKCGTTKNPSKPTALALAIALELNLDETKDLLSRAGYALSPCSKTDVIVQYFIEREAYSIHEVNAALFEHGEQCLTGPQEVK